MWEPLQAAINPPWPLGFRKQIAGQAGSHNLKHCGRGPASPLHQPGLWEPLQAAISSP
jgi:hypothetical protein